MRIYWNHIQRPTSPAIYRVVLGRIVTTSNADYVAGRHETFDENPVDNNHTFNVAVGIECWVPVNVTETQEMMCEGSQYGNITTLAIEANQVSFLRIYGYNANGGLVDIDPVNTGRDYIWIRQNDPLGPIVEAGIVDVFSEARGSPTLRRNYGGVRFGAAAFPPAPTNTPVPTNTPTPTATPLPALNVGPQISADGGVIPASGRDIPVSVTDLGARTNYRLTLTIEFNPTLTTSQATAASGWNGVCGTSQWQIWIRGRTSWDALARLRACMRPPWGVGVTGTTNLHYLLEARETGFRPRTETVSMGTLAPLNIIWVGPSPTPTPTARPGAQPGADAWFDPIGGLGENVVGIGGDTAKAAIMAALALAATILAYRFSESLPVSILGGALVIIGGVPLGLTPIWVIAGLGLGGVVLSGFALFFRSA